MAEAPLDLAARASLARGRIQAVLRGDGTQPWSDADILALDALVALGRPGEVVDNLPPVTIAPGDRRGGRMGMPGEDVAASALHTWRLVARRAGVPLPAPHVVSPGGDRRADRG